MKLSSFDSFSFGCRVNHAEREEIDRQMIAAGFMQDKGNPDIFIVNTCSVTHKAEREARQLVYQKHKENPETKIVVTGCSATYWLKTGTYKELPIDLLVDNTNKEYLVELVKKRVKDRGKKIEKREWKAEDRLRDKFLSSGRLMVKIQDGCHRFCSFCIVPYLRGLPKSKKITDIVDLINSYEEDIREVTLTAINTEAFGKDTGETLIDLIKTVFSNTKVRRLSFGSVHPWSVTEEFIDFYKKEHQNGDRMVKFFHIPLQSGSNKILSLMKRCHTREDMMERVWDVYNINPNTFIATDIIVGYLEETEADFAETYDFLEKSPINKFHVLRFSKRQMTAAYYMSKRLKEPDNETKNDRSRLLRELSEKKYQAFQRKLIGYRSQALFLQKNENLQETLLDNQVPVYLEKSGIKPGSLKIVEVEEYKKGKLFGKIVG